MLGLVILLLGAILRYFKQPYVIAYIVAGIILGEHGLQIITDEAAIASLGEFGLILLLFFIGMETSLPRLVQNWQLAFLGTGFQVLASIGAVALLGYFFHWPVNRILVMGFVVSLSSSAVVIKLLQDNRETETPIGQNVISILLTQDVLIVPMLIAANYLGGAQPTVGEIILQLIGGGVILGVMYWIFKRETIVLPFSKNIEHDHELQVFVAIIICFGIATITALFGLSAALGAFVAGMVVHAARSTGWFHDSLHAFRVVFVALFFVSIGMLIDLHFLMQNKVIITGLLLAVFLSNHLINAGIFRYFGNSWKESLYGGALLAQIGELSFVVAASAFSGHIISDFAYQLTVVVISLTLLISPFWIAVTQRLTN